MVVGHVEVWLYFPYDVRIMRGQARSGWSTTRDRRGNPRSRPRSSVLAGIERGGTYAQGIGRAKNLLGWAGSGCNCAHNHFRWAEADVF
jgi:hypothetical protein